MKRKITAWILVLAMAAALAGCAAQDGGAQAPETTKAAETGTENPDQQTGSQETTAAGTVASQTEDRQEISDVTIRVGSLKGPTSMGLVSLMDQAQKGETSVAYEFTMATAADEINTSFIKGELDLVLIPANVASVLYNKTDGDVVVVDINTLGVLYVLESGDSIKTVADLAGKTVYLPGKGTTPDYALQYVMAQNGLTAQEVDLQYKSEAAEVISALAENPDAVGLLPQPAATTACIQNEGLRIALDLTEEWDKVSESSSLVTGVTVVRRSFLEENEAAVQEFLKAHAQSAAFANENVEEAAQMVAALEIVPKAAIAAKAIPYCNLTCITGQEMQTALSGYLEVLAEQNAEAVGGKLPAEDFYYLP